MGIPRYAAKRDGNENPLVALARASGLELWKMSQLGDWLCQRGEWSEVWEIKNPETYGKLTPMQEKRRERGLKTVLIRTEDDVKNRIWVITQKLLKLAR